MIHRDPYYPAFAAPYAWRVLREAYRASPHEPTLLKVRNIDAFTKAIWNGWAVKKEWRG